MTTAKRRIGMSLAVVLGVLMGATVVPPAGAANASRAAHAQMGHSAIGQTEAAKAEGTYGTANLSQKVTVADLPPPKVPLGPGSPDESDDIQPGSSAPAPNTVPVASRTVPEITTVNSGIETQRRPAETPNTPTSDPPVQQLLEFAAQGSTGWYPPDTQLAVGPSSILEMVNSSNGDVYSKATGALIQSFDFSKLFGPPTITMANPEYSDAKVLYDQLSGRFFAADLILDNCDSSPPHGCTTKYDSQVTVAVSETSDPLGTWDVYAAQTTTNNVLLDQPKLGVSSDEVVLTDNENGFDGPYQFIVVQKSDMLSAVNAGVFYFNLDSSHYNLIPAQSLSATDTEYAVSTHDGSSSLTVDAFKGTPDQSNVSMSSSDLTIGQINQPPLVDQAGSTRQLDTGPAGMQSAVWDNGMLWAAGNDKCTPSGDTSARTCTRVEEANTSGSSPSLELDSDIGQVGAHLWDPAVMLDSSGNAWLGSSVASTTQDGTAAETFLGPGPIPSVVNGLDYAVGSGSYDCCGGTDRDRWGDFSGAVQDPSQPQDVCMAEEFGSSSTTDDTQWGTAIACFTTSVSTSLSTLLSGGGNTGPTLSVLPGTAVTDSATLSGNTPTAGGTVTYSLYSDAACTVPAGNGGMVTVTNGAVPDSSAVSISTPGTYYWQASYNGDSLNLGSQSSCGSEIEYVRGPTTITTALPGGSPSVPPNASVADTSTLTGPEVSGSGGMVTYTVYSDSTCTTMAASTTVTVTNGSVPPGSISLSTPGTYYWQASYNGDKLNDPSESTCGSEVEVVQIPTTTSVSSSANPSVPDQTVTFTATVSPVPDGGMVAFSDNGSTIVGCGAVPVSTVTGMATCTVTYPRVGRHAIVATYSGDVNFALSHGKLVQVVKPIVITVSPDTLVETGQAEVHAVIEVRASPSYAGVVVNLESLQLQKACGGRITFQYLPDGNTESAGADNQINVTLDSDGNATVAVSGTYCVPGHSVVKAKLMTHPSHVAKTTLTFGPPAVTTPGLTVSPSGEVETGEDAAVYAVFTFETNSASAGQKVAISSAELESSCRAWVWDPGNGGSTNRGSGVSNYAPSTTLDSDGNAVFVFAGVYCTSGTSTVTAVAGSTSHTTAFSIVVPQP